MVLVQFFKTDEDKPPILTCHDGNHFLGRGDLLGYSDYSQVSRRHALLNIEEHAATITAMNIKPVYYMQVGARKISLLHQNEQTILKDGDKLSLNPAEYWYRVKIKDECREDAGSPSFDNVEFTSTPSEEGPLVQLETVGSTSADVNGVLISSNDTANTSTDVIVVDAVNEPPISLNDTSITSNMRGLFPTDLFVTCYSTSNINSVVNTLATGTKRNCAPEDNDDISTKRQCLENLNQKDLRDAPQANQPNSVQDSSAELLFTTLDELEGRKPDQRTIEIKHIESSEVNEDTTNVVQNEEAAVENQNITNVEENVETAVQNENSNVSKTEVVEVKAEKRDGSDIEVVEVKAEKPVGSDTEVVDVKADKPDGSDNNGAGTSSNSRDSCWYGNSCFRKNEAHRRQFSHPGDSDYYTNGSDPNDTREECPYGASCYRKNPQHRRQFKHPSAPLPRSNDRLRTRRAARINYNLPDSPDDYDLEDPFINDGSSDEYNTESDYSESDSDAEFTPSQEGSEDIKKLVKEAKKFTKQ